MQDPPHAEKAAAKRIDVAVIDGVTQTVGEVAVVIDEVAERIGDLAFDFVAQSNPKLENMGLRYFAKRARRAGASGADDEIHVLNPAELARLSEIGRRFVLFAGFIGLCSGIASGLAEFFGQALLGPNPEAATFAETWPYHLLVHGVTLIATLGEVWALYWVGLRGVHDLAHAAGVPLAGVDDPNTPAGRRTVALALARVALELPSPPTNPFGVNPYRELPKWRLVLAGLVYKLKITVTTFVIRALLARSATRFGLHAWLAFISAPVTAVWDGFVAWLIIKEAKIRAMGPSAAHALVAAIDEVHPHLSAAAREVMARAVASTIVRSADPHPNLLALLTEVRDARGAAAGAIAELDDTEHFLAGLAMLPADERDAALEILALAVVIDGAVSKPEVRLVQTAAERCGFGVSKRALSSLRRDFVKGRAMDRERLAEAVHAERSDP